VNTIRHSVLINILLFIISIFLCFWVRNEPFFWDTIQLGAMHGDWFYQQHFQYWLLPDSIDSGHIPAFGWYLALIWIVFEQNLIVSHFAMSLWIFLLLMQLYILINRYADSAAASIKSLFFSTSILGLFLFLADPVLISQMTLVSPDVVLIGAFLLGINSILDNKRLLLALAIIILGLISMRGIMVAVGLFIWQLSNQFSSIKKKPFVTIKTILLPYLPAAILVIVYLAYHFQVKGWIGIHERSPWAASFAAVGLGGIVKQFTVLIWRLLDFGRVFVWLALSITVYLLYKRQTYSASNHFIKNLFSFIRLAIILLIILGTPAIFSAGLSQHRYFLPFFIIINLIFFQSILLIKSTAWRRGLWAIAFLGLITGNRWVYPNKIAQGWDASLAHKPYFECKNQLKKFLSEENILSSETGTVFPEIGIQHYRYLNDDETSFQPLDMNTQQYVFYSNIMNDFSDKQLDELEKDWDIVFHCSNFGIHVYLYQSTGH